VNKLISATTITKQATTNATGTSQKLEIAYTGTRPKPGINLHKQLTMDNNMVSYLSLGLQSHTIMLIGHNSTIKTTNIKQ